MHSIMAVNSEAKPLTSLQRVVHILSDFQDHENTEFFRAYMPRYGARVHDLRRQGIQIESKRLDASRYQFRLVPAKDVIDKIKSIMPESWEPLILSRRWF